MDNKSARVLELEKEIASLLKEDEIYEAVMQSDKAREMNEARANNAEFHKSKPNHIGE